MHPVNPPIPQMMTGLVLSDRANKSRLKGKGDFPMGLYNRCTAWLRDGCQ